MRGELIWILLLILPCMLINARSLNNRGDTVRVGEDGRDLNQNYNNYNAHNIPKSDDSSQQSNEQVISVRITSSIAVDRGRGKPNRKKLLPTSTQIVTDPPISTTIDDAGQTTKGIPQNLAGANIEFIKQLNSKKGIRGQQFLDQVHPYQQNFKNNLYNETEDSIAESSIQSVTNLGNYDNIDEINEDIPLARSIPLSPSSKNLIHGLLRKSPGERGKLTTVSFNVVHNSPKNNNYNEQNTFKPLSDTLVNMLKVYSEPEKVYSQPAKVYSEPAKFYSEPAKVYSEPAKIYSEPAKVYSEPAKIYSEPAKFYSQPASLHLPPEIDPHRTSWPPSSVPVSDSVTTSTPPSTTVAVIENSSPNPSSKRPIDQIPEKNYEIDEKVSVMTDGRTHGEQESSTENCKQDNCKVGYVVEGRQYRKYRVEERTPDGFIVGEYGVVRNEDGALRGVRYTADSEASPRLIYDALMKFLQL